MRVALLSPKGPLYRYRGGIFKRSLRYSPLTLVTLAGLIPKELGVEVLLFDEGIEEVPDDLQVDLVGISLITGSAKRGYELADRYRARGVPVVLGGPHVTLVPEDARPHADTLVIGYAEHTWPQLLRDHKAGLRQAEYRQAEEHSLANMPLPRRDLLKRRYYTTTNVFEATRGCIHDCDFCVVPSAWGRSPYQKPVEDVVKEIQAVGARKALFIDLNLIADKRYAKRLFEAFIPMKIQWFGLATTLLQRDQELLDLMARSGCTGLLIGLESIWQDSLDGCGKGFNASNRYMELVEALHRKGITLMGTFVFGLDGDTPEVFMETARFAVDACIDLPRFAVATPFPGTPFFQRLESEGRLLTRDWDLYDGQHVVFQPKGMSVRELQEGHEAAWRYVYKRRNILRRIAGSRLQIPLSVAANWGYRFYANHLDTYYNCDWYIGQDGAPRGVAA